MPGPDVKSVAKSSVDLPSPSSPDHVADVASYIQRRFSSFIQEHDGVLNQDNYDEFARDVIKFARARNEGSADFFATVKKRIEQDLTAEPPSDSKRTYDSLLKHLFESIDRNLNTATERLRLDPTLGNGDPIPNGSFINGAQVNIWQRINGRGLINGGVYRSGDPGTALTPYSSLRYNLLKLDSPFAKANVTVGVGAYAILPDQHFSDRSILGTISSMAAFAGFEQPLFGGLHLRAGVEAKPSVYFGRNQPENFDIPWRAGFSFGTRVSSHSSFAVGARTDFQVFPRNVQDIYSIGPNYDNTAVFTSWISPIIDARVELDLPRNERVLAGRLQKSVPVFGGLMTFSLTGRASLGGEWSAYPPGMFFGVGYSTANDSNTHGVSVKVDIDPHPSRFNQNGNSTVAYYATEMQHFNDIISRLQSGGIACSGPDPHNAQRYTCLLDGSNDTCSENNNKTLTCTHAMPDVANAISYQVKPLAAPGDPNHTYYGVNGTPSILSGDPVIQAISNSQNLSSFVTALNSLNYEQRLEAINTLAYFLYQKSFDGRGEASGSGGGRVNTVSHETVYAMAHNAIVDPNNVEKTTVCRGIAAFIADVAHRVGFESHAVTVQQSNMGHVVVMLRAPNADGYSFINRGDTIISTGGTTAIEALQTFSKMNNYPPQVRFVLYDHGGRYERTLLTNEGRMLYESVTPPDQLQPFLEGRR